VDHRTPVAVTRCDGGTLPEFKSPPSQHKEHNKRFFQPVCRRHNSKKRESCQKCLSGGTIELPPELFPYADLYLRQRDGSCSGCYWHNPATPIFHKDTAELLKNAYTEKPKGPWLPPWVK
jgi:hypothetical protein